MTENQMRESEKNRAKLRWKTEIANSQKLPNSNHHFGKNDCATYELPVDGMPLRIESHIDLNHYTVDLTSPIKPISAFFVSFFVHGNEKSFFFVFFNLPHTKT